MRRALLKKESGSVLVMATFVVAFTLVIAALVLDLGQMWVIRARLQAAADAATLAAVQCTKVAVSKKAVPQVASDFFRVGEDLPPSEDILEKDPVFDGEGNLLGYDVTWITGYKEEVVNYWAELDRQEARAEAQNLLIQNALRWAQADQSQRVLMPFIVSDSVDTYGKSATYSLRTQAEAPSLLVGPAKRLFSKSQGEQHDPVIVITAESESTARVGGK
jgi:hypothetical protein